jgi:hypothetical protein
VCEQCPAKSLWVVILQDVEDLFGDTQARGSASSSVPEVDQQRQALLARWVQVYGSLQHVDQVLYPLGCLLGVLVLWQQVEARPSLVVKTKEDLLASCIFFRDVVGSETIGAVLTTPY